MNIFEALRKDHDKQRALLDRLSHTSGASDERVSLYAELKEELQHHAVAEERHFYSPLIDVDMTIELSRHGIAEHHEIDELLEEIDDADMSTSAWMAAFKKLKHKVEHHLEEEEQEFFPVAGRALSEEQKQSLAEEYAAEMHEQAA
ncbi:hemerythrin domain-containing protein [Halioxenophilus aromaticivorans]|uniref:Hemerythrin domain-containing protein n=1 Tax=Halioxenophilus aromaticivorans TaxID=1306992 RepID=A0AAV3U5I3_9ALTE